MTNPRCGVCLFFGAFDTKLFKKKGSCPQCQASLLFEVVNQPASQTGQEYHEEYITREELQEIVDGTIHEKSHEPHPPRVQDIAIMSTFDPPRPLVYIEKNVDRLLRARG